MPVIDAMPRRDNPPAAFPEDEKADSVTSGEVVLRFVVDRTGTPDLATIELVRATSLSFARAAVMALPSQRFEPATIRGCAVAQAVDYSFGFVLPNH
jgi:TonB family protein